MRALAVCAPCDGYGVLMKECGKRCEACKGLGYGFVAITEDEFFAHLPPGMSRDEAKHLLASIRDGRPAVPLERAWSPYPIGNDKVELARPEPTAIPGAGRKMDR